MTAPRSKRERLRFRAVIEYEPVLAYLDGSRAFTESRERRELTGQLEGWGLKSVRVERVQRRGKRG